jgi:PIN domain nuclease of toxin-antitoxin system
MIVLDTHALLWWVQGDQHLLGAAAKPAIAVERSGGTILISSISVWELALLIAQGRIRLASELTTWLSQVGRVEGVRFVPIDNEIAVAANNLPGDLHRDPADRMIVATARRFDATLITGDRKLRIYPHVRTIW